jgi:uncharacterized protein
MRIANAPNSRAALMERRAARALTWAGPALLLFARSALAVAAQALVALVYQAQGSATPWRDAGPWLPVYGTLIDLGCLGLLWRLTRREGISLVDLFGIKRSRLGRDLAIGLALIPPSLVLILAGNYGSSLLAFGNFDAPDVFKQLPLLSSIYAVLVFPLLWGVTEQATYNGYLLPRLEVLSGSTALAVALVAFSWSFQHAVMPLTFDPAFMLYRALAPLPFSIFQALLYLRLRSIVPLATAHWLMDGGDAFYRMLWPLMQ